MILYTTYECRHIINRGTFLCSEYDEDRAAGRVLMTPSGQIVRPRDWIHNAPVCELCLLSKAQQLATRRGDDDRTPRLKDFVYSNYGIDRH